MHLQELVDIMRLLNKAKFETRQDSIEHSNIMLAMGKVDALGKAVAKIVGTTWNWM